MILAEAAGLAYETHGGGGSAPPLAFLHGAGGSRLSWPPRLRRFPGRWTLCPDLPGHGGSPVGAERSIGEYARRVERWLEAVGAPAAWVVGHSMGSAIALTLALDSAARVAGIVLVGSGARLRVNPALLEATRRGEAYEQTVEKILGWSFAPDAAPGLVHQARRRMLEAGPGNLHRALTACHAFDVTDRLQRIAAPTLVLVGEHDRMTPPDLSRELAEKIAGARLETVAGAGHMLMLERPEAVGQSIQRFLESASG